ncbi:MAG: sulfatase-like hydrolase/transferase [Candidatus Poribacteria bacterium]|nr:sulfatase-like hydrolase/transferase [Candidatus Poribacteria bacterium]
MPNKTNILLITSDQQHWNTFGCLNPELKTPNLDKVAAQGTMFTRAYCPNPTCTPTRASIITGMYPSQHGAYSLGTKLLEDRHTVGEDFSKAGYRTALVGKAHFQPLRGTEEYPSLESYPLMQDLDYWREFNEPFYGFEHIELARNHADEGHVGQHYAIWMEEKGLHNWRDYFRPPTGNNTSQKHTWEIPEEFHYNTWIAERSNALLDGYAENDEPFFLWASFLDPHPPYLVPRPWDTMYDADNVTIPNMQPGEHDHNPPHFQMTQVSKPDFSAYRESGMGIHGMHSHLFDRDKMAKDIAIYYAMVSCMDKYIGAIIDKLDALGLAENTLVVYTSDHGHFYGQHGLTAKGPFHYEDVVRVPFVVRQPGTVPAGVKSDALQTLVDLAPSFLTACGIDTPRTMTGIDQTGVWRGESESARDHVFVENRHEPTTIHLKTLITDRYKLTVYYNRPYGELFDLQEDPDETRNRWDDPDYAGIKSELLLKFVHGELGMQPLPMPRIHGA